MAMTVSAPCYHLTLLHQANSRSRVAPMRLRGAMMPFSAQATRRAAVLFELKTEWLRRGGPTASLAKSALKRV